MALTCIQPAASTESFLLLLHPAACWQPDISFPCVRPCATSWLAQLGALGQLAVSEALEASALRPCVLAWLAGAGLLAGRCGIPFDGADAAWLVAFAHPVDV